MPPVTTSSTGLMLMREVDFSSYEYRLFYVRHAALHMIASNGQFADRKQNLNETPTEVTLMLGNEGVNGGRLRTLEYGTPTAVAVE